MFVDKLGELPAMLPRVIEPDDVFLGLGAGDIGALAPEPGRVAPGSTPAKEGGGA